jgi:hypothetical protein
MRQQVHCNCQKHCSPYIPHASHLLLLSFRYQLLPLSTIMKQTGVEKFLDLEAQVDEEEEEEMDG